MIAIKIVTEFLNTYIIGPSLPLFVFATGLFFTVYLRFFHFVHPGKIISVLLRKNEKKGMSPLKSALLALASTLGVGNIVGVSTAIFAGGPGAVFWMTLSAFAAMPLKYGEIVLAVLTRKKENGEYFGGAMYYINEKLKNGRLAAFFAVLCIVNSLCVGNVVQIKAVSDSVNSLFGIKPIIIGVIGAFFLYVCVKGGTKRISKITAYLVPVSSLVYIAVSVIIIVMNKDAVGGIIKMIFESAFSFKAASGGLIGIILSKSLRYGVSRGIMSNEAGSGTAPTAHAKSNLTSPCEQGFWGIFEVFADTVIMCNMTAFPILMSYYDGVCEKKLDGMQLVIYSYEKYLGRSGSYIIVFSVVCFAFATLLCQIFYGRECVYYLSGENKKQKKYSVIFILSTVIGSVLKSDFIWSFTDLVVGVMTVINTSVVFSLRKDIKQQTLLYFSNKKIQPEKNKCETVKKHLF